MDRPQRFTKVDLTPRRHHGYAFLLFLFGTLFPPLAVAARFGIGGDFFLNLFLTICGYIPGHVHNFYIQNIRNNKNHRRTPKWASRYGLVDTSEIERKQRKSQWAHRYNDRLPTSAHEGQDYEEGQDPGRPTEDVNESNTPTNRTATLWSQDDETYYGRPDHAGSAASLKSSGSAGRWHYPANFADTEPIPSSSKKKKMKKDRWARTEDARMGVGMEDGSKKKKKKKKKSRHSDANGDFIDPTRRSLDSSTAEGPEDPERGNYGPRRHEPAVNGNAAGSRDEFDHQF